MLVTDSVLFPRNRPQVVSHLEKQLHIISLNQHIKELYNCIGYCKRQFVLSKQDLRSVVVDRFLFHEVLNIFGYNNEYVKLLYKQRLQTKLQWVLHKYYPFHYTLVQQSAIVEPADDRLTVVDNNPNIPINLTPEEKEVLQLGPNFAISPNKINDELLDTVQTNIAHCVYNFRWRDHHATQADDNHDPNSVPTTPNSPSTYNKLKKEGCPFQRPFIPVPPTDNLDIESDLRQLQHFITTNITTIDYRL